MSGSGHRSASQATARAAPLLRLLCELEGGSCGNVQCFGATLAPFSTLFLGVVIGARIRGIAPLFLVDTFSIFLTPSRLCDSVTHDSVPSDPYQVCCPPHPCICCSKILGCHQASDCSTCSVSSCFCTEAKEATCLCLRAQLTGNVASLIPFPRGFGRRANFISELSAYSHHAGLTRMPHVQTRLASRFLDECALSRSFLGSFHTSQVLASTYVLSLRFAGALTLLLREAQLGEMGSQLSGHASELSPRCEDA